MADEMESLYSETESAPEKPQTEEAETKTVDQESAEGETAVVSNKVLSPGGEPLKEGDTLTITVVKNYGDESEIKVQAKAAPSEITPPAGTMEEANKELAMMGT